MNDPLAFDLTHNPLTQLFEQHFSPSSLRALLGEDSGGLGRHLWSDALEAPLRGFMERPSKSFRSELVSQCYALAGGVGACPTQLGAIVEVLHAGSLIIDDIEDGSSSRRGGPALHRMVGVPVALNAGNWMYFWALALIEQVSTRAEVKLTLYQWAHRTLLRCHHGQALDLTANVYALSRKEVAGVVQAAAELKTGALMELSAVLGAVAAGASDALVSEMAMFGRRMGVALQMLDDVGGLISEKRCHKGHEDLLLGRPTWPWAWLSLQIPEAHFEELRRRGREVARRELHPEVLARLVRGQLRGSGRVRVRREIHQAFAQLAAVVGQHAALPRLRAELQRMEQSYA
jgi:geranylgeranyl pyrophosphate synthase